jgi:hypothetical protein
MDGSGVWRRREVDAGRQTLPAASGVEVSGRSCQNTGNSALGGLFQEQADFHLFLLSRPFSAKRIFAHAAG